MKFKFIKPVKYQHRPFEHKNLIDMLWFTIANNTESCESVTTISGAYCFPSLSSKLSHSIIFALELTMLVNHIMSMLLDNIENQYSLLTLLDRISNIVC